MPPVPPVPCPPSSPHPVAPPLPVRRRHRGRVFVQQRPLHPHRLPPLHLPREQSLQHAPAPVSRSPAPVPAPPEPQSTPLPVRSRHPSLLLYFIRVHVHPHIPAGPRHRALMPPPAVVLQPLPHRLSDLPVALRPVAPVRALARAPPAAPSPQIPVAVVACPHAHPPRRSYPQPQRPWLALVAHCVLSCLFPPSSCPPSPPPSTLPTHTHPSPVARLEARGFEPPISGTKSRCLALWPRFTRSPRV